jgi:diguanylate cyclase (GGDEF)-like protein
MMPGMSGVEVCRQVRRQPEEPYIYVILLTAKGQKQDIVEGLDAGADDYLTKPFDAHELRARLRAACRIVELQQQLISAREELRVQATRDALTGIWNRGGILEILNRELARAEREKTSVGVILADLDHFKEINDIYGHLAGDAVLREAVRKMRSAIRVYDTMGRYGGEEFLIVMAGCDTIGAPKLAERIRAAVGNGPIEIFEGTFPVTVSLGVAVSEGALLAESIIRAADLALYRAKNGGRNRVELAALTRPREMPE